MNKDKVTNICGIVIVIAGALVAGDKAGQISLPNGVDGALSILITIGTAMVAYFTGKPSTPSK